MEQAVQASLPGSFLPSAQESAPAVNLGKQPPLKQFLHIVSYVLCNLRPDPLN